MNAKAILVGAVGLLAALAPTVPASADTVGSDQNLRYTRAYIQRAVDTLSHDQSDYGGHRIAAVSDLQTASADLTAALRYDRDPGDATIPQDIRPQDTDIAAFVRNQSASNRSIDVARTMVTRSISMLDDDAHDYNGYRLKAIGALSAARDQLADAIQYRDAHGGSGVGSDDNLRYSRLYLERAVDMLSHDDRDYAGHRVAAMSDIQRAQSDLAAALAADPNREDSVLPTHAAPGDDDLDAYYVRRQFQSNDNMQYVSRYVARAIDMLQRDQHDYAGYRAKAIDQLQAARQQISLALASR